MHVKIRRTCRLCGSQSLTEVLSLGPQMLASTFVTKENESRMPTRKVAIDLVRCNPALDENACGLVQLRQTFPSDIMYTDYWYASGVNQTMRDALRDVVEKAKTFVTLAPGDVAVDIGCNDGTLLRFYAEKDLTLIGFDPARNFRQADEPFIRVEDYFNAAALRAITQRKASIVTSIAMFYDLEDPTSFTQEIADVLADDGIWVVQLADLPNMLRRNMFDSIYHEHLEYYHLAPLEYLFAKCGLKLVDIEKNSVNGSSYRLYVRKAAGPAPTAQALERMMAVRIEEFNMALDTEAPYQAFRADIEGIKKDLRSFIETERAKGKKIFVYGASSKGNVLLQYCELGPELIPFAADRNPRKWGTKTLGTNIPIISEEEARAMKPDYFLVLPYHFLDEMTKREKEFLDRGGKFIIPVPHVRIGGTL